MSACNDGGISGVVVGLLVVVGLVVVGLVVVGLVVVGAVVVGRVVVGLVVVDGLLVVEVTPPCISFKLLSTASAMTRLASAVSGSMSPVCELNTDFCKGIVVGII